MEIVAAVAKWAFVVVGVVVVLAAAISSAIVGMVAIRAAVEMLIRKIERRRIMPSVRPPVIPRYYVRSIPQKR